MGGQIVFPVIFRELVPSSLGFGHSTGDRSLNSFLKAQKHVLDFVARKSGKRLEDIILLGHSMGGAVSTIGANSIAHDFTGGTFSSGVSGVVSVGVSGGVGVGVSGGTERRTTRKLILLQPLDASRNVVLDGCKMTGFLGVGKDEK